MLYKNKHKILTGLLSIALLVGGCAYLQGSDGTIPKGKWRCTSQWSHEKDGVSVLNTVQQQFSCADNILWVTGIISIGSAKWSEKKEGTCYASGEELYGTWTSVQTVPQNDAARQFEQERFGGKSLASVSKEEGQEYRVRVTSRTETQFEAVNPKGQVVSCHRLEP